MKYYQPVTIQTKVKWGIYGDIFYCDKFRWRITVHNVMLHAVIAIMSECVYLPCKVWQDEQCLVYTTVIVPQSPLFLLLL